MPTPFAPHIILSQNDRTELQTLVRAPSPPQSLGLRVRIILQAADAAQPTNLKISPDLNCFNHTVGTWRRPYIDQGLAGLQDAIRFGRPRTIAASTRVRLSRWPGNCPKTETAPSPTRRLMRLARPESVVFSKRLISSRIKVSDGGNHGRVNLQLMRRSPIQFRSNVVYLTLIFDCRT
jgi:hypothetical protein